MNLSLLLLDSQPPLGRMNERKVHNHNHCTKWVKNRCHFPTALVNMRLLLNHSVHVKRLKIYINFPSELLGVGGGREVEGKLKKKYGEIEKI